MPREPLYYCYRLLFNERQFGVKKLAGPALELGQGHLARIEFLEQGFLSKIILVYYTRFALEHGIATATSERVTLPVSRGTSSGMSVPAFSMLAKG